MKNFLLLACAVAAMVSCKKEPFTPTVAPVAGDEIQISSSTTTKGLTPDYEKDGRNNFFAGDQIGIFVANQIAAVENPFTFTPDGVKSNRFDVGYEYAEPYWKAVPMKGGVPSDDADATISRLMFPTIGDKVAKLYAYFPYSLTTTGPKTVTVTNDADVAKLTYALPLEQSADAVLRTADLMWAKNDNTGAGWAPQSAGINLEFNHLLTKLTYAINIKNTGTSEVAAVVRYVRAVEVKGKNVLVDQAATFQIEDGKLTPASAAAADAGSVFAKFLATDKGLKVETKVDADGKFSEPGDAVTLDMLLYPFADQVKNDNEFAIYLSKDNLEIADFDAAVKAGTLERYVAVVDAPEGAIAPNAKWHFAAGRSNVFKLTIDPGDKSINITTTIKAWDAKVEHDLSAD